MTRLETTIIEQARHELCNLRNALLMPEGEERVSAISASFWMLNGLTMFASLADKGLSENAIRELFAAALSGAADQCGLQVCAHGGDGLESLRSGRCAADADAGANQVTSEQIIGAITVEQHPRREVVHIEHALYAFDGDDGGDVRCRGCAARGSYAEPTAGVCPSPYKSDRQLLGESLAREAVLRDEMAALREHAATTNNC